jgi:hypothetical protein
MSKSLVPEIMPTTDISDWEREKLQEWIEQGKPDVLTLTDDNLGRAMELYLSGKTYREISQICNVRKVIIMYMSDRYNWFAMKEEILNEMDKTQKARVEESKVRSTDFMLKMAHAFQKKMGKNVDKYLATDNEEYLNMIDKEQFSKLMKVLELLHRGDAPKSPGSPAVNINMNMGNANISKAADGSVDISSTKEKTVAAKLKEMADAKRAEERALKAPDIKKEIKPEGDPK